MPTIALAVALVAFVSIFAQLGHTFSYAARLMDQKAVLVSVRWGKLTADESEEHLDELAFLAETLGLAASFRVTQRLPRPDVRTFVRKGKLEEAKRIVSEQAVRNVIFDHDLSPSQLRNIEREFNPKGQEHRVAIYDRSFLILNIFLRRAQTTQSRAQVQLAMNQYLLPRLAGMWTHLERQRGGTGARGGAGEKEIETDRRNIGAQITVLKAKLAQIDRQSLTRRKAREGVVRVSLVGYTNAGKSTLMNLLARAGVKAENKLFATVDTVVRKVFLDDTSFLLSDTVGFIRKLPTHLIESFKSTLDEVREADILLHVADVGHPAHHAHIETVNKTLADIGVKDAPTILVLNKMDALRQSDDGTDLAGMIDHYSRYGFYRVTMISAASGENIDALKRILLALVKQKYSEQYPYQPAGAE